MLLEAADLATEQLRSYGRTIFPHRPWPTSADNFRHGNLSLALEAGRNETVALLERAVERVVSVNKVAPVNEFTTRWIATFTLEPDGGAFCGDYLLHDPNATPVF